MIGMLTQGRLGNQMFQFAFIYAASKQLNTPFFIVNSNSLHYFKLHEELIKNNTKNTLKYCAFNLFKKSRIVLSRLILKKPLEWLINWCIYKNVFNWDNTTNEKGYLLTTIKNNVLYSGYFQSEKYFIEVKKDIQNLFEITPQYKHEFLTEKAYLFAKKTIAIHIRRTDYLHFKIKELGNDNLVLPINYYKKCLNLIGDTEGYNVLFISDDIEFVKKEFSEKDNYFYENNTEIIDFQLLLNADILIIANSSFSWWAAWLNKKINKIIYAPNYFLGFKINRFYPAGIKINDWNWIDVY
jgi:Glycosyl transferase family 11